MHRTDLWLISFEKGQLKMRLDLFLNQYNAQLKSEGGVKNSENRQKASSHSHMYWDWEGVKLDETYQVSCCAWVKKVIDCEVGEVETVK